MNKSIGRRLFINLAALMLVLWIAVVVLVAWVVRHETNEIFDSGLKETAQRILPLADAQLSPGHKTIFLDPVPHDEYLSYQVVNAKKEVLLRSHNAPENAYDVPLDAGLHERGGQVFCVEGNAENSLFVVIAESAGHRTSTIKDTLIFLTLPLIVLIPFTGVLVWWSVRRAQESIFSLGAELTARSSHDLHPVNNNILPRELISLGEAINSLLYRLQIALESERNFSANSAHELRTPIAAALAQLDVLKTDLHGDSLSRAEEAKLMLKKLENMTVKLLQLARAESGVALNLIPVELNGIMKMLVREFEIRKASRINFECDESEVWIKGDVDAVGIAIQNLLENAMKYATPNSMVEILLSSNGVLEIQNDCDPVPSDKIGLIRQRFGRVDASQSGSGIGLSIVETIVSQCNGSLQIKSPCYTNHRGFSVTVCFETTNKDVGLC
ncbi:MAG: HAMP domain-containing histidine kinase [Rhodocyclaceae bacterium]|nr:HAMP domain-containing histidine kinase [Rhodocyclaceae bacterium]